MNVNPVSQPLTSTADAQKLFDGLKMSLLTGWTGAQAAMDFFIHQAQEQAHRIEALEQNLITLQTIGQEKDGRVSLLTRKVLDLESTIATKEQELQHVRTDNGKMKAAMKTGLEGVISQRKRMEAAEAKYDLAAAELDQVKIKLANAEKHAATMDPQGHGLSSLQIKNLEMAVKAELQTRAKIQALALQESVDSLKKSLATAQARIKELEEQLQAKSSTTGATPASSASDCSGTPASAYTPSTCGSSNSTPASYPPSATGSVSSGSLPTPPQLHSIPDAGIFDFLFFPADTPPSMGKTASNTESHEDSERAQKRRRVDEVDENAADGN